MLRNSPPRVYQGRAAIIDTYVPLVGTSEYKTRHGIFDRLKIETDMSLYELNVRTQLGYAIGVIRKFPDVVPTIVDIEFM